MAFERCQAFVKKSGDRCKGGAIPGTRYCGPHQEGSSRGKPTLTDHCEATTKDGKPCRGGVAPGERFCGPHLAQHGS